MRLGESLESVVACDDGVVEKLGEGCTVVACILWGGRPLDVELNLVKVDGLEASAVIAYAITKLKLRNKVEPRALLLDSITIAGFNIASPPTITRLTEVPVIVTYKYKPSSIRLEEALRKHFKDWQLRMKTLKLVDEAVEVTTRKGTLFILTWGVSLEEAVGIVEQTQIHARTPEPLRVADIIAYEVSKYIEKNSGQGTG